MEERVNETGHEKARMKAVKANFTIFFHQLSPIISGKRKEYTGVGKNRFTV